MAAGWGALKERDLEGARRSFEAALLTGKHIADEAEAYEGLGWVAWWANDADARFPARERAYALYRQQGDPVAAARQAVWLGCDHHDFGGEHAVANGWYQRARVKPWFDVWLPDSKIEQYVGGVVPTLGVRDVGAGFVLIFPVKRSRITRPSFLVPDGDGNGWVYLFDILTTSPLPGPDPDFAAEMLERKPRLYVKARDMGGTRYPIGSLDFTPEDWVAHYGERWLDFQARKRRFDPQGILTPGPGIFTPL